MVICWKCGRKLKEDDFYWVNKEKNVRNKRCIDCVRHYQKYRHESTYIEKGRYKKIDFFVFDIGMHEVSSDE